MRFALTPEQQLSRDALRELLREHCTASQLRAVFESEEAARIPGLWSKLTDLGVIGALAPEALGGLGLDAIDLTVLLEETGRAAVPEPVVETAAVAVPLLAALAEDSRAAELLTRILAGKARVAVAFGSSPCIGGADISAILVCARDGAIHLLEPNFDQSSRARSVDRTRQRLEIDLLPRPETQSASQTKLASRSDARSVPPERARPQDLAPRPDTLLATGPRALQLTAAAFDHAALGTAAQLLGLGARMLELTTQHVLTREQFGRPIGSFQAVKHQLVDAHVAMEFARPLVYRAAHSIAREDPARSLHVSMAKAFASDAALLVARKALQLHGAIGYSYEYDLQLFMKRSWVLAAAYGDALEHRKRIADATLVGEETHV